MLQAWQPTVLVPRSALRAPRSSWSHRPNRRSPAVARVAEYPLLLQVAEHHSLERPGRQHAQVADAVPAAVVLDAAEPGVERGTVARDGVGVRHDPEPAATLHVLQPQVAGEAGLNLLGVEG